ncbi:hypothetical protein A4H02_08120 [Fervidobacterium thailandense]|uniref:HTH arsR-type domain-containing protein n=2 Tax=Fervidobacterium thailandense TaxID=1008305 RepID=A0A1E3G122_9BACT|nr:hypothetical protein A4H02_08120 [Fervidobacterium thailandense]
MKLDVERLEKVSELLKILAHPVRLQILFSLGYEKKEKCVCELLAETGVSQSNLSQHLSILKLAGLVKDRRQGNMVFYSLASNDLVKRLLDVLKPEFVLTEE